MSPEEQKSAQPEPVAPPAPEAAAGATESSATAGSASAPEGATAQPTTEPPGDADGTDDGDADTADGPESADGVEAPDGAGAADTTAGGEGKPKRKRKRRRKKKPGTGEAAEGAGAGGGAEANGNPEGPPRAGSAPAGKKAKKPHRPSMDRAPFQVGEEVFGKVTSVLDRAIMVDLSGKALAILDRSEMEPDDLVPSVGDRFVARVHQDGARGGLVVLTRKPLRDEAAKPWVEQACKDGSLVPGLVTGVIRGGVEVDIGGLRAFAPASGMDLHPHNANFAELVGQVLDFKILQFDAAGRDIVVTRRPMLEAEAHERRKKALSLLTEGQVMKGVVRTVVEWGVFVALPEAENLEGLVHVSEASHDPHARLTEMVEPGDETEVKILKIDERGKIWLSRKALVTDPWAEAKAAYAPGSRHTAKVTRVERFGVFVELGADVEGLIHVADLTLKKIEHPKEIVNVGDTLDVIVHEFDARERKIALHPAPPPAQADEAPQKVARNAVVKVQVVRGEAAGVVVRLLGVTGRSARGFIPAGQTGTPRGTDLRKKFPAGQLLEVKIVEVDPRRGEARLSIRQAAEDEERRAHKEYRQALAREGGFGTLGDLFAAKLK